jgi:TDP-4-keto-6-deoxy-D-glucose transaminase
MERHFIHEERRMHTGVPSIRPARFGREREYVLEALSGDLAGDGPFVRKAARHLASSVGTRWAMLAPSCTHALELAALALRIGPGDEILMPSFTFVSTASAFALRGAIPVWVDIRPDTLNIDETKLEAAITPRTKAIVVVHYAGVACAMDEIMAIARRHGLAVVEDAAHAYGAMYRNRPLGAVGDLGCFSFHSTKNISCGEGGALVTDREDLAELAEIIRDKGTDRARFFRGEVDKYTWRELGSSYIMNDLTGAYLLGQLESAGRHTAQRLALWQKYYDELGSVASRGDLLLPIVPEYAAHNAHLFVLRCESLVVRTKLIEHLKKSGVQASFHYVPLHSAPFGEEWGRFSGKDQYTTCESEKIVRLPLSSGHTLEDVEYVTSVVRRFFG